MACYCFLRNVVDKLANGLTPYKMRFGVDFEGLLIPFGSAVEYKPASDKDQARTHSLGKQLLDGVFMGYHQRVGGSWSGDVFVADQEEIEQAESMKDIHIKRFMAPEVFPVKIAGQ